MGMHTGYVHPVADGKITDLKSFALMCARAMSACVMQRDDPRDAPPPRKVEPDLDYYTERLKEAEERLTEVALMTTEEREAECTKRHEERVNRARELDAEERVEFDRIQAMHDKVSAWKGAPEGLKEFMLQQLGKSLDRGPLDMAETIPEKQDARHWYEEEFRRCYEAVGRAYGDMAREKALAAGRTRWLEQLWASVE